MSKKRGSSRKGASVPGKPAPGGKAPAGPAILPLKPRPRLFRLLALLVALWVALLLIIYFTTVRPARSSAPGMDARNHLIGP